MKTLLKNFILVVSIFSFVFANAQTIGAIDAKEKTFGIGKIKSKAKKMYISNFEVNFQMFVVKEKTKKGGAMFRDKGVRGDATAGLAVGLNSVSEQDLQTITDALYADFLNQIKKEGFELVSFDAAAKTKALSGWQKVSGPNVTESEMPGLFVVTPTGFDFLTEEKSKVGSFLSNKFQGNMNLPQKISDELDDAVVADVQLYYFFMKDKSAFQGNAANIKIKTGLNLVANEVVVAKSDDKSLLFRKQTEAVTGSSQINFVCGKLPIGGSAESSYNGSLKNDVTINGVVSEEVIQSFSKQKADFIGTSSVFGKTFSADNSANVKSILIPVEPQKYNQGTIEAGKAFINYHFQKFAANFK